jgi:hypothetical protein
MATVSGRNPVRRLRRLVVFVVVAIASFSLAVSSVLATSDTYYGHLHHDGSLTWFTSIQRYHQGGSLQVTPNNGPNANGAMRMGLAYQVSGTWTQFTNSYSITCYSNCTYGFYNPVNNATDFSARWFIIDARMTNACGIFCDDDFGGTIYYSL